ncbi:MAG: penicillin-binding protein 2 [Actinomycetaceae bacterium]|nr:penicillin-binding protein 2 [Actinomycetaceae bacterium]
MAASSAQQRRSTPKHPGSGRIRAGIDSWWRSYLRQPIGVRRIRSVATIFLVCAVVLTARLVDLQVVRAATLSDTASSFRTRTYTLHAKRGDILDSSGAVLATSIERYNVGVNQKLIGNYVRYDDDGNVIGTGAAAAAEVLAPLLDMDQAELGGLLLGGEQKSTFVYIKKDISPELWREINSLGIAGIEPEQYMKREYPNGAVAGNVIGYVGETEESAEATGQAGIERSQNDILSGTDGSLSVELAGGGAVLPNGQRSEVAAIDGSSVKLTIDRDLENELLEAVNRSVQDNGAEWGAAVVIEIGTGRVLALVDSGSPDPSNLAASSADSWGSRAVSAPVEPGSTGKLVTFSATIDQGTVSPESLFTVPDTFTTSSGETIHDNDGHATEDMTVAGILAKSYNTGLVQIGDTISDETRYNYMTEFGLGSKTGIELPAESAGILSDYTTWDNRTRYTTMFGQGWAATTLQLAQIGATIGNGGVYVPAHIVDSTISPDGQETPTVVGDSHRVISEDSADTMLQMMQAVTDPQSTGYYARVEGYNIAGKTGTAQVADENGNLTKRVGTFVGVIPAEDPQIAVAVVVYNAAGAGYGGEVAAPVFSDVAGFAVRQLGIPPSTVPLYKYPWFAYEMGSSTDG